MKKTISVPQEDNDDPQYPFSIYATPIAILVGSLIIAISVLISGGIIPIKGIGNTLGASAQSETTALASPSPSAPIVANVALGKYPIKGSNDAKVTVVEFADFRCPFCDAFYKDTESQLMKDYVDTGKVRFAFRNYEFLGDASVTAGNAASCANEQGKFWQYHDYLYQNQPDESDTSMYTTDKLTSIAQSLGLNASQFKTCLQDTKYSSDVTKDMIDGKNVGVTGTPTFFIGKSGPDGVVDGVMTVGAQPYSTFKTQIDVLLK